MELARLLVKEFLGDVGPKLVKERMQLAVPQIVKKMEAKGMTPANAATRLVIRDALFLLWKAVVKSGDLSDLIRDRQDESVIALVSKKLPAAADLETIVIATATAAVEVAF